ncbi:excinuclease ABC subunit UvrC [Terriglobus saanensis]|uniref:UvrABC system protein C n=1 Tax=Terriglobus saanensis (strain ATCC BAA-1853 / DSM 23119 / SP1PR4) TaxID=401053 RepID=E8UZF2_TERSS|nr:excinuclease ABC subunit UvrC [Terriglobus saanensis]ADV83232.1 excinuclease ABC, C subunit [Terriglobus saanensis SP1PR4]
MDINEKIRTLPTQPGVYLYKNAEDEVIYVGKAKNLRSRVRSYFLEANQLANRKTGSLMREAVDLEYILVANEREALALENNLIKQRKPRFNILLRDDKTYPYVKLTVRDRHPKVFVTRKLKKDGALYFGPYFPGNLAYRLVDLIHRSFLIPSCKVDLSRYHPRPCLEYYIKRCLAPCVENLVTPDTYRDAIRDVQLFLEGKESELEDRITARMHEAAASEQYELAARLRDQIVTVHQLQEKQRIASTDDSDADVFGFHFANDMLAVNQFHMRSGKIVDRRDFFFEDLPEILEDDEPETTETIDSLSLSSSSTPLSSRSEAEGSAFLPDQAEDTQTFNPSNFFAAFLKQLYLDQPYVPRTIMVPAEFRDRDLLATLLCDRTGHKVEILAPQRGEKRSLVDLVCQNAKQSYDQRFRTLQPSKAAIAASLQDALGLADPPKRIECFDISHIQGAETVASMVVWEDGEMKKSDYRKFKVNSVSGVDDFASMHEILTRRYSKLQAEKKPFPSLILIDGGLGQLHAAYAALEQLGITLQPLASIAKREEIIYVHGQEEDPVVLDRRSPVLHLVQHIRDESHRFAVTYHRKRREIRDRETELLPIPGVGPRTRQRLIEHFGSIRGIKLAGPDALTAVVNAATAEKIRAYLNAERDAAIDGNPEPSNPLRILS